MNLQELLTSKDSPLSEEQRAELQEEYFSTVKNFNERIHELEAKNNSLSRDFEQFEKLCNETTETAKGCLDAVVAMLQGTFGATHRQRDFYDNAIIGYIKNMKSNFKPITKDDLYPF